MDNTKGEYEVVISTVAPPSVDKEYLDNYIKDRLKLLFRDNHLNIIFDIKSVTKTPI